ncbi:MAG: hypothetical protein Q4B99_02260 [Clostridia bacterium]|nr:hypothetical protein [Clostridia bacterium]
MASDTHAALTRRNKYSVARRSIWYLLRTALIVAVTGVIIVGVTLAAAHAGSIYIIATEGITLRANCILNNEPTDDLEEYFLLNWLEEDELLNSQPYRGYTVTYFDYRLSVEGLFVLPWSTEATIDLLERVPVLNGTADETGLEPDPPAWTDALYRVHMLRDAGRWYIASIEVLEANPAEEPYATPDMSLLPDGDS